jgi:cobalt-precorrin-5B (C1)-methyltransferase
MILVFGGTTEGKKVAEILDFIDENYWYSTKIATSFDLKGKAVSGGMDTTQIVNFCRENQIRLLIDAAHPFAENLHQNIHSASLQLEIPVLRYERVFQDFSNNKNVRLFDSYQQLSDAILSSDYQNILSLTGVQTIEKLKSIWQERNCYFRILDTDLSRSIAKKSGISHKNIISLTPKDDVNELVELVKEKKADILLSKESGTSGYIESKIVASEKMDIPLWIVKHPVLPEFNHIVTSQKQLLQQIYTLRKSILKKEGELRSGFTSGTCVTAAVKADFMALTEGKFSKSVEVFLPDGESAKYFIFPESLSTEKASCTVIKNGGDDPDITHAKEIGCELSISDKVGIHFKRGKGIGEVTLPGLQVAVGEPAINPVPREMITEALESLKEEYEIESGFDVKPFVPEGEKLGEQTFNPRVGVIGGISIIGTTGHVKPYSNEAFLDTIKYQLSVAYESGVKEVVFTSGKRSENILRSHFPHLPDTSFIHFGNMVGESIKMAVMQSITEINLAMMLGKAVKLAEGNLDTHSKNVQFNATFVANVAKEYGCSDEICSEIRKLKLANAILDILPYNENISFYKTIAKKCLSVCSEFIPFKINLNFYLVLVEREQNIVVQL